jgi:Tol biopolymer transport system component
MLAAWAGAITLLVSACGENPTTSPIVDSHSPLQLTAKPGGGGGTISPANPEIAFLRDSDLRVANADGSNNVLLFASTSIWSPPSWAPFGTGIAADPYAIVFAEGCSKLYKIDVSVQNGSVVAALPIPLTFTSAGACGPEWAPDGSMLAYHHGGLYVLPASGGTSTLLYDPTGSGADGWVGQVSWSPDGTGIAFIENERISGTYLRSVRIYNLLSGAITTVAPAGPFPEMVSVAWSRAEPSRIAFTARRKRGAWEVWSVSVDQDANGDWVAQDTPAFMSSGSWPSWSPDDARIVKDDGRTLSFFNVSTAQSTKFLTGIQADWR